MSMVETITRLPVGTTFVLLVGGCGSTSDTSTTTSSCASLIDISVGGRTIHVGGCAAHVPDKPVDVTLTRGQAMNLTARSDGTGTSILDEINTSQPATLARQPSISYQAKDVGTAALVLTGNALCTSRSCNLVTVTVK